MTEVVNMHAGMLVAGYCRTVMFMVMLFCYIFCVSILDYHIIDASCYFVQWFYPTGC